MRTAQELLRECEQEVARLKQDGWTRQDFAQALCSLLYREILRDAERIERSGDE